ncbi:MAG: glycosyltransferase family 4 protein [Candidatus Dormibacteraeota bacterium]|nr:glycosyltransferase family 4 protein [Candidatus Dormibacteraeota bacterium]
MERLPRIGLLHYTCPPVIGGVETILYEQARRLSARGYPVTILSGRGGPLPSPTTIQLRLIPELDSKHPEVTATRDALDRGEIPSGFEALRSCLRERLAPELGALDVLIVHNAFGLHFNLALTSVLWDLADEPAARMIAWYHDLSWVNPLYKPIMHPGEPWSYLRRQHPRITPVFISAQRRQEWQALTNTVQPPETVIPNGIDPFGLLRIGPATRTLIDRFQLDQVDAVLLAPVRITRRKNLEWAIEAAAAIKASGRTVRLLITGPPGPHNPRAQDYVEELKALTARRGLEESVCFLFEQQPPGAQGDYAVDAATLSDLYMLSDVVTLPSTSEGFGLPLAEAAIFRTPVVCSDLAVFREVAPSGPRYVPTEAGPAGFSQAVLSALDSDEARLRRRVMREYAWDTIIQQRLEPLLTRA